MKVWWQQLGRGYCRIWRADEPRIDIFRGMTPTGRAGAFILYWYIDLAWGVHGWRGL